MPSEECAASMELFQIWVMGFFTLAIFSFLYRDNPIYKFAEHLYAGISAGYYMGLIHETVIRDQIWVPIVNNGQWTLIIPSFMGILMFSRLSEKYSYLSRIGLAFIMGSTAGIFVLSELHGNVLGQMKGTMVMQTIGGVPNVLLTAIVVVGVISTLIYFYFSSEHKGILGITANVGIWCIMISFGAHFGYTVMGRISLLIGRVYFLINEWGGSFSRLMG